MMAIFLATTLGMCAFVVTWSLGLAADVGGLIALAFVGIGILIHMAMPTAEN